MKVSDDYCLFKEIWTLLVIKASNGLFTHEVFSICAFIEEFKCARHMSLTSIHYTTLKYNEHV